MAALNIPISFQAKEHRNCTIHSEPTRIVSWGFEDLEHDGEIDELSRKPSWGAVVGCSDGSIYVFSPNLSKRTRRKSTIAKRRFSGGCEPPHLPYRRQQHLSLSRSRNASPSGSRTNLTAQSSKSRAVSGLSKEQVEAPKNYVDFDDEQEKMKGMIAERKVKDVKDRSPRASYMLGHDLPARRFDDTLSIASVETSSTMLSPPLSPILGPTNTGSYRKLLQLRVRILPRDFGSEHSVVSLSVLEDSEMFLSLQESGKVSLFKSMDGICVASAEPGTVPASFKTTVVSHGSGSQVLWAWQSLHIFPVNETSIVVALAKADDRTISLDSGEADEKTRFAVYELTGSKDHEFGETSLSQIGDLILEGHAEGFVVCQDDSGSIKLYQVENDTSLTVRTLTILPRLVVMHSGARSRHDSHMSSNGINLPQSIRNLLSRNEQQSDSGEPNQDYPRFSLQYEHGFGKLPLTGTVKGLDIRRVGKNQFGIAWSTDELTAFTLHESTVIMRSVIPVQAGLRQAEWIDPVKIQLLFQDSMKTYSLPEVVSNESSDSGHGKPLHTTTTLFSSVPLPGSRTICSTQQDHQQRIFLEMGAEKQQISILPRCASKSTQQEKATTIWTMPASTPAVTGAFHRITATLPIELNTIVIGYDDGYLNKLSLERLIYSQNEAPNSAFDEINCAVLSLFVIQNPQTGQRLVISGGDDGSIAFWDLATLKLLARWVVFTEPLAQVVHMGDDFTSRLRGCCMCISSDGTIAVIAIDGFNFLYLIPGSPARLQTLCLGSDNLMLFYVDGRTRIWDVKTREFRRSMNSEKAAEMLSQDDWFIADIEDSKSARSACVSTILNRSSAQGDPPPALVFEAQSLLENFSRSTFTKVSEQIRPSHLQTLLAALHIPGMDEHSDRLLNDILKSQTTSIIATPGFFDTQRNYQSFFSDTPQAVWHLSPEITAVRLLAIVALLNALSAIAGFEQSANAISTFYTVSLASFIGPSYQAPSLAVLAYYWNESEVDDIRSAAKLLFDSEIARLPDDEIAMVVEKWRHRLPCILPEDQRQSAKAALALCICGNIAIEKFALLSSTTLSDVAKSVLLYFNDDTSPHRVLAIDLCSRGFETWQQYFDAMEALRSLFVLATTSRKEAISTRNPGPYARMAVLQIASSNSPLFVTTLSLDILHPRSLEYSKSVLQIIAFLIRKKPLVLYPNLPRLMEAVVKSLDPGQNAEREAVQDSVTEIIALVVQTFPTLDFHAGSQRLAVGTNEGAVIMYDLKTATRLYVLEGHRKGLAGICFSPDGRRMVTLSVEESVLLVWKVGSSFTSFFHPGAPPRQGRSGSEPYKTLNFVLQDHATLTIEASLKQIHFKWPSDRSVQVQIRDAVFTFST
ncbi:WD40 repeat-like protein [Fomitiporia mediterranea MF3/22]|uniref:WD40 repeat-like protein n=1 Tax=Fomitiporia mediterranea (strain MF3/22) TaxID=694068 RepID=UPI00044079C2|nr:WD40 repeat-like protein [Fomitiporia mediterranea MF3/22]EJC98476.1 WD40 repeat-like protein [Fomitiporia mediterranea MF3/22]